MIKLKDSFVELRARDRAKALLDEGTFRELLGPFEKFESPHLEPQGIVPQCDDGVVVARGTILGERAVVIAIEGAFQGGGIGEVSGAKIAGALEIAVHDNEKGVKTNAVIVLDSGGVRLQEANYGLLSISEIQSAIVALRNYVPVIGVIPGKIGCFGGMSMTAGLFSKIIITREGRMTLNGPEVIEQEAGVAEFDASDKRLIWNTIGGAQRQAIGLADILTEDDINDISEAVRAAVKEGKPSKLRSKKIDLYLSRINTVDPTKPLSPMEVRKMWVEDEPLEKETSKDVEDAEQNEKMMSRGRIWFEELTGVDNLKVGAVPSVLCADGKLGDELVRYIAVVPNPNGRFPRARKGEVGLEEGWTIAKYVKEAMEEDANKEKKRPIIAVVDVPSQAYGYKEELLGIFQSCAGAVDAYASARYAGHPIVSLLVGPAISGAFLTHGYQANRIIALDDPGVLVHAMSKQSAARITKRTIEELDEAAKKVPSIAYDIQSYSTLGTLEELVSGIDVAEPNAEHIKIIKEKLCKAIEVTRTSGIRDLSNRLTSEKALIGRAAGINVRSRLKEEWD
ncbi:biotin-independent malonate decarboxylase subunit beta [Clostridium magnum]|uniref:Malonyl-S-ACP:biotin-protein carboxyltransferase MADC n=1 Tax=Clostridium magnum DSM 2767 TaxID=1121326 RepID=A0A161WF25_9CLOT|nr:biotin-independent malonate decarboxylase subunit beta [Clostridium magnum]KZL90255.1 malonyl-S-ACP:biotin-protein carboxyltransferase MADC [Clostridium magnum DSM 2767]SHI13756.1 malonate decarboxylase beta subunit [Clostridium magnum DSM 2767]